MMIWKMINLLPLLTSVNNMLRKNTSKLSEKFNLTNNKSSNQAKSLSKLLLSKSNPLVQEPKVFWKIEIQQSMSIPKNPSKSRKNTEEDKAKWLIYSKISMVKSLPMLDLKEQACQLKKFSLEKVCLEELKNLKLWLKDYRNPNQIQNLKLQENPV